MLKAGRLWLAVAVVAALALGAGAGAAADQAFPEYVPWFGIGTLNARGSVDTSRTAEALRVIAAHYDGKVDYTKLTQGSVRGMVDALGDPYTRYLDPKQYKAEQDNFAGRHQGVIGIYLSFNGSQPLVTGVVPGSPAQAAGLQAGDVLTGINGQDTGGMTADVASTLIRGDAGSMVKLAVQRAGQALDFSVTRADFTSPMVLSANIDGYLYVRIYQFGDATASQFDAALKAGLPGAKGVVLDLRGNPGGYIDAATQVISRFVDSGEAYELRDHGGSVDKRAVSGDHPAANSPTEVLVDANTASAAEIVSGSLQAHHRAQLVGTKTFGKGSVQVDYRLGDGSDIHLTVQHWFLPDGRTVDKVGLQPDVGVTLGAPSDMYDVAQPILGHARDGQLNRALQLIGAT